MIRVSNRRRVRRLGRQAMGAAKTRNVIAVVAIALTTVLFTSLFTIVLSINDGFQEANFRQAGGYAHGTFKSLTLDQVDALKEDPLVEDYGLPAEKGIVGHFSKAAPDEIFTVGDRLLGFAYIPKSSIVYLETGDVIVR